MTNQESQIDCNINIYFVIQRKYTSEEQCNEDMWHTFNSCCDHQLLPQWITEEACASLKPVKNDVFVFEEFVGETFEKLKSFKCSRIVGPRCLLTCFTNGEPIPEGTSPVFTTAMRGLCVCVSGLSPEAKEHVQQLVEYMGGFFTKRLRSSVTHLITESVMSVKYEIAAEMKIQILTKEWVDAVWEENLHNYVPATDDMFNKYKCPVFRHLVVTSTNLPKRQKEEVKRLISENGGTFMGPLDGSKVTIVLAPENSALTEKLKYAMQANIACLKSEWVYESISAGYALPFHDFLIKSTKACSTPEKTVRESFNCSAISNIPYDPQPNYVNETVTSTISNFSNIEPPTGNVSPASVVFDRLNFGEAKMAGPFLDGCNIYLAGFPPNQRDKINRILNVGSATRLDDISDAVSHVIIGDANRASGELKLMKSQGLCPYILTLEWLEESIKLKRPAPEEQFLHEPNSNTVPKKTPPPSPLSKKNLQMLQQPKRSLVSRFDIDKQPPIQEENGSDLVEQYLQKPSNIDKTAQNAVRPQASVLENQSATITCPSDIHKSDTKNNEISLSKVQNDDLLDESAVPISQSVLSKDQLFEGLTFIVTGFTEEDDVEKTIRALGGQVLPSTFTGIPSYVVVPVRGTAPVHAVSEVVTDLFIEDCVNQEQIVDVMYYHRPLSITKNSKPLSSCVVTFSTYTGVERMYLWNLAMELGATCQDIFARRTNVEKNTLSSTHLICPLPEGNKYVAAVKWKLPAVKADWLKTCAARSKLVDETPFLVGETMAPKRPNVEHSASSLSEVDGSEHFVPQNGGEGHTAQFQKDSPFIHKRVSSIVDKGSPSSPFHVSTPDAPYGQVFKPNPSPNTRKYWHKWVNNFPDLRVKEPTPKKRRLSTPLSELKQRLWQKLKDSVRVEERDENQSVDEVLNNKSAVEIPDEVSVETVEQCDNPLVENNTSPTSIKKKLNFDKEDSPLEVSQFNFQLAQLDQMLQQHSRTSENRLSSGESSKKYEVESPNFVQNCHIYDSQPVDAIVWEEPSNSEHLKRIEAVSEKSTNEGTDENQEETQEKQEQQEEQTSELIPKRKFLLSGIKDRTPYEQVIRDLGGEVLSDGNFDISATHLLCTRPSRNEKMLCSIAAGKWVLHCLYLRDSENEGKFLDEEKYEWGNPRSKGIIPEPSGDMEKALAAAAHKWRLKLLKEPSGAFHTMVALLLVSGEKYEQFKRLIEAGGGMVVQARPPYDTNPSGKKITHCFVNVKQFNQPVDWAMLASKGILCFLPQYLGDYLTTDSPLNPREYVIPEFRKYLALLPK